MEETKTARLIHTRIKFPEPASVIDMMNSRGPGQYENRSYHIQNKTVCIILFLDPAYKIHQTQIKKKKNLSGKT